MPIKNLMEDIVYNTVDKILKDDQNITLIDTSKDDIVAYILNRLPPKYITSERGVLHGKLEAKYIIQKRADILLLIYDAINEINTRRASETKSDNGNITTPRLPHIIGEVLEESTFSIIPNVKVSLMYNNTIVNMIDPTWKNPYITHKVTMGHYHFWPEYADNIMKDRSKIKYTLLFNHSKFEDALIDIELDILSKADMGKSYVVPIVLMKAKNGVEIDFLYDE